jgi:hypothetical protein
MPKKLFEEHELLLLEKWEDAQLLKESIESIYEKYEELFDKVLSKVAEEHKELELTFKHLNRDDGFSNCVAIGKKSWPSEGTRWISGLYIDNIGFENLISEDEDYPCSEIYIYPPKSIDLNLAMQKLRQASKDIVAKDEFNKMEVEVKKVQGWITFPFMESGQALLDLLKTDEANGFIQLMVEYFEQLTQFIPVLDDIFKPVKQMRSS